MKGPSLDAIRRFKEQQERKKHEEADRKIQEKLSTLEHRSAQGDRKAKQELKKIRDQTQKPPPPPRAPERAPRETEVAQPAKPKPKLKPVVTDFEELMRLAKQNSNQVRDKPPPQPQPQPERLKIPKKGLPSKHTESTRHQKVAETAQIDGTQRNNLPQRNAPSQSSLTTVKSAPPPQRSLPPQRNVPPPHRSGPPPHRSMPPQRNIPPPRNHSAYRNVMPSTSRDEDEYESDGFVVSDEDDDARAELNETLRSVFRYDRRRCDLREEELDRQYRAIGKVSTFEDLEREERRAARLAAAEDARALRDEEERKRLKKIRLDKERRGR